MAAPPPDLSVIIVNYNVCGFLEQALRSVQQASRGLQVEVWVVDNNSVDDSVEMVRTRFPSVHLIANEVNVGFGRANNQAIRQAQGRHLLILNPDTIVREDTLLTLVCFLDDHPEAGAVGCQILNPDGSFAPESRRAFPTPEVALYRITGLSRLFPRSRRFGRYNLTYLPVDAIAEVDALSGSCMMVRHAALYQGQGQQAGAGLFDEDFFMYGEDLDWCFRIQQAGWKVFYTPDTQIIHYKGESTKKGDLRYVRLFYGAMLLFTRKHFTGRYSRLMAGVLQMGILARAALTVGTNTMRRLGAPLLDFALVYAAVTLVGLVRSAQIGSTLRPLFFLTVAPVYALGSVAGIALLRGYRPPERLLSVLGGTLTGLVAAATLSFFVKGIAYSRLVVLAAFPVALLVLVLWRLRRQARVARVRRRAVVVGPPQEARRLHALLALRLQPPFELIGYVTPDQPRRASKTSPLPRLGGLHQLRDLVRLRRIDDVVFVSGAVPNHIIFSLIRQLQDLPVQFRMLAPGRAHVIGKAAIDDFSMPPLAETEVRGALRRAGDQRAFEVLLATLGLFLHPFLRLLAFRPFFARLSARTRQLPDVVWGRKALIGYDERCAWRPPPEWNLRPGVFPVTETLAAPTDDPEVLHQAWWFYVSRQSAALDWDLLVRAVRNL
jgi:hypothetical protein